MKRELVFVATGNKVIFSGTTLPLDTPDANGNIWPKNVVEKALNEYSLKTGNGTAFGNLQGDVDERGVASQLARSSHKITKAEVEDDHVRVMGEVLATDSGWAVKELFREERLSLTTTGFGSLVGKTIQNDLTIESFDFAERWV